MTSLGDAPTASKPPSVCIILGAGRKVNETGDSIRGGEIQLSRWI